MRDRSIKRAEAARLLTIFAVYFAPALSTQLNQRLAYRNDIERIVIWQSA